MTPSAPAAWRRMCTMVSGSPPAALPWILKIRADHPAGRAVADAKVATNRSMKLASEHRQVLGVRTDHSADAAPAASMTKLTAVMCPADPVGEPAAHRTDDRADARTQEGPGQRDVAAHAEHGLEQGRKRRRVADRRTRRFRCTAATADPGVGVPQRDCKTWLHIGLPFPRASVRLFA